MAEGGSGKQASQLRQPAENGGGAVTLPTRPPPSTATIFLSPGILSFPFILLQPFSPRREPAGRWCLPKPGGCWGEGA